MRPSSSVTSVVLTEDEGGLGNLSDTEEVSGVANSVQHCVQAGLQVPSTTSPSASLRAAPGPAATVLAEVGTAVVANVQSCDLKSPYGQSDGEHACGTAAAEGSAPSTGMVDARIDKLFPRRLLLSVSFACAAWRLTHAEHTEALHRLLWAWLLGPASIATLMALHIGILHNLLLRAKRPPRRLHTWAVFAVASLLYALLVFMPHLLWALSYVAKALGMEEGTWQLPRPVTEWLPALSPLPWPRGLLKLVSQTFFKRPYELLQDILHRRWPPRLGPWREAVFCTVFWAATCGAVRVRRRLQHAARELAPGCEVVILLCLGVCFIGGLIGLGMVLSDAAFALYRAAVLEVPLAWPQWLLSVAGFEIPAPAGDALVFGIVELIAVIKIRYQARKARWAQHRRVQAMRRVKERIRRALKQPFYPRMAREAFKKIRVGVESVRHRRHRAAPSVDGRAVEEKRRKLVERRRCAFEDDVFPDVLRISVRRDHIIQDSLSTVWSCAKEELMAGSLEVVFEDEFGADHGGLQRDWFDALGRAMVFDAELGSGHFCVAPDKTLTLRPRRLSESAEEFSEEFSELYALGRALALAIWFGTPLAVPMSDVFCKMILGESVGPEDLRRLAPDFFEYRVERVLRPGGARWVQEELCRAGSDPLCFMSAATSLQQEQELCEGGSSMQVTEENKHEYVMMLCEHFLCGGTREQIKVLLEGFTDLFPIEDLKEVGLTHRELAMLVAGYDQLDVVQWRAAAVFKPCPVTNWFWEVVQQFSDEDRAKLLHFTTGASRLSIQGFEALRPQFTVTVQPFLDRRHLPHAHTCTNELVLPEYSCMDELKERLLVALAHDVGFGFV